MFGPSGATLCDSRGAAVEPEAESDTDAYVFGSSRVVQWPKGHAITMACPTTPSSETVPKSVSWWARESAEFDRWSPITHSRPSGTVTSNGVLDGVSPG